MTRAELKALAKQQIKGSIGTMFVIALLTTIITGTGLGSILTPGLSLSLCMIYLNMTKGQKASVGDMFEGVRHLGKAWWLNILIAFFTHLLPLLTSGSAPPDPAPVQILPAAFPALLLCD